MRKRVKQENGLEITAVIGTSAVLLSFEMEKSLTDGLLGFAIEREDHTENEKYYLKGFKYFEETAGNTFEGQLYSTFEHPVQSFLWEDFSVKCDHDYSYNVSPVYGKPKYLKYGSTCTIRFKMQENIQFILIEVWQVVWLMLESSRIKDLDLKT